MRSLASGAAPSATGNISSTSGTTVSSTIATVPGGVLIGAQMTGGRTVRIGAASAKITVRLPDLKIEVVGATGNLTWTPSSISTPGSAPVIEGSDAFIENVGVRSVMSVVSVAPQGQATLLMPDASQERLDRSTRQPTPTGLMEGPGISGRQATSE